MHARSSTKLGKCHIVMFATAPETAFSQLCSWSGALHARHACAQACTRKICLSACAHACVQACPRALAATSARGHASSGDVSEQLEGTPRGRRQLEGTPRGRRRQLERRCQRAYGNASMPAGSACAGGKEEEPQLPRDRGPANILQFQRGGSGSVACFVLSSVGARVTAPSCVGARASPGAGLRRRGTQLLCDNRSPPPG